MRFCTSASVAALFVFTTIWEVAYVNFREELTSIYENKIQEYFFDIHLKDYTDKIILPNKEKIPLLYRFSPADYNNIRCLETGMLYLSECGNMNDIFEGVSCKTSDLILNDLHKLKDLVYLKSFTENLNNLKMWSEYADNYEGMCVQYDIKNIDENLLYHLFPVVYSNKRHIRYRLDICAKDLEQFKYDLYHNNLVCDNDYLKDTMPLFVVKSKDWETEQEWRIIVSNLQMNASGEAVDEDDEYSCLYEINKQYIQFKYATAVYLGPKIPKFKKQHIVEIAEKIGIKVYESYLSNDKYELVFKEYIKE